MENNIEMISNCIENFALRNDIKLDRGIFNYDDFGSISINISPSIDISYIGNLYQTLKILSNEDFSPIVDDGYTGIDKLEYNYADQIVFDIDFYHVLDEYKDITISFLKERCDENLIDDLLQKIEKLTSLGFESVELIYSNASHEIFEEKQKKRQDQGIYDINALNSQLKEYQYELEKIHGFIQTIPQIDEIAKDTMNSKDIDECVSILESKYSLTKNQAQYISDSNLNEFDESYLKKYKRDEEQLFTKIKEVEQLISKIKA